MAEETKAKKILKIVFMIIFIIYLLFLFYLTFFSRLYGRGYSHRSLNLLPLKTILQYTSSKLSNRIIVTNLLGNIEAFVPMGFLLPVIFNKTINYLKAMVICAGISLFIEITQYTFAVGAADIDDLMLNLAGGLAGYVFYILARLFYKKLVGFYKKISKVIL